MHFGRRNSFWKSVPAKLCRGIFLFICEKKCLKNVFTAAAFLSPSFQQYKTQNESEYVFGTTAKGRHDQESDFIRVYIFTFDDSPDWPI